MGEGLHRPVTRRRVLQGAAVVAGAATLPLGMAGAAAAATFDSNLAHRFIALIPGGDGVIYAVRPNGDLYWYRHIGWTTGEATWSPPNGVPIGQGFHQYRAILAAADGQLFCFGADGLLRWFRFVVTDPASGTGRWVNNGVPLVIRSGFGLVNAVRVFGGWGGVIYAQDTDGKLWYYRYLAGDGTNGQGAWANDGVGTLIGSGFHQYVWLTAGPDGVIYGYRQSQNLEWWRFHAEGATWENSSLPIVIGSGFDESHFKHLAADNNGVIYAVALDTGSTPMYDDTLKYWRLLNYATLATDPGKIPVWATASGGQVGNGFSIEPTGALQGYVTDLTTNPGDPVDLAISTGFTGVTVQTLRVAGGNQPAGSVAGPVDPHQAGIQPLTADYRSAGCGWTRVSMPIDASWKSGLYAFRLLGPNGLHYDIPFVVRNPATDKAQKASFAYLAAFNTYNAYNTWGGHNRYTVGGVVNGNVTVSFLRPSNAVNIEADGRISHTMYNDLFLLHWMDSNAISYDCYIDGDLDAGVLKLADYKALVIGSHPEYWSKTMHDSLATYLANGGRLIYTGGNGVYESMSYAYNGNAAVYIDINNRFVNCYQPRDPKDPTGATPLPDTTTLGTTNDGSGAHPFGPYTVIGDSHSLLLGTNLVNGNTFGSTAYDGGASGWEVDKRPPPSPTGPKIDLIATGGINGADMTFWDRGNGGWVFAAGSIAFNGSLPHDEFASKIMWNVFRLANA
jgi:N,N-dimethylformamidase